MSNEYIVICQQIVGSPGTRYVTQYNWNGERFNTKAAAVSSGFTLRDSDDFNIGTLRNGRLVAFHWMDKQINDPVELAIIAEQNGLEVADE